MIETIKNNLQLKNFIGDETFKPATYIFQGYFTGLLYVWRGNCTVNIHLQSESLHGEHLAPGLEVDMFTLYGDDKGGPPSYWYVKSCIAEREREAEEFAEKENADEY